ncbi:MAG: thiamine pyrophosphate-requiring protein [Oscillochloris sp.]|nr:thiamine pyrophosphate-requiring protein [Oscillochloris sp.]
MVQRLLHKDTASDYMMQRLYDWGIRRIYGYPGDGINGIMGALDRAQDKIRFVQTRHEEMAAFMACAHAKFTGEVGVCLATSGPGAIHLLNGLYDARMDHQPVLAIVGQQKTTALGADYQQEVDLISLFKDVARDYVHMATTPAQIRHLIDRGLRIAKAERSVTCIIVPNDVQEMPATESPPREHGSTFSGIGFAEPRVIPHDEDLRRAADVLNSGKKVAMLVGAGALGAHAELAHVAELLGAGVAKALLGKAALPDNLPYVTGAIGLLGTRPSWDLMMDCDTLFMIGTSFPYAEFLPKEGQARGVQIDIKPRNLSLRYPMEVNLCGDSQETLKALIPLLRHKQDRSWREKIASGVKDWWELMEARAMTSANPINPQRVFWDLSSQLPHNVILTADSGSAANWYARDIKMRQGMMGSLSGNLATMCPGVPYAIAAKFTFPDRPVIAFVGDGAMQMLGNNGLITIGKYWKEWTDPRLIVLVLNNGDLNQVTWEQRVLAGDPKFEDTQNVPRMDYAAYAELQGLRGISVKKPEEVATAWQRALAADRPVVIDAHVDPEVPPLPPHISFEQARAYAMSIIKGDPNRVQAVTQSIKELAQSFIPTRGSSKS